MKPPAFQFYANDFVAGTAFMSAEEVGAYIRLLCYSWINGPLPTSDILLTRLAGCSSEALVAVRGKFQLVEGKLINVKLESVRDAQRLYSQRQSKAAHDRWDKTRISTGNASAMPPHMPNGCSSSSSSTSSLTSINTAPVPAAASSAASEPSKSAPKFDPSAVDLPENLNSARMRDAWAQWCIYRKERKQPMTAQTVKLQLAAMSKWGEPYTVSAIEKSIMNSWRGVFAPNDGAGNQSKTPAQKSEFADAF